MPVWFSVLAAKSIPKILTDMFPRRIIMNHSYIDDDDNIKLRNN